MTTRLALVTALLLALAPAVAFARDTTPPTITPEQVTAPAPGQPVVVAAKILDASGIFEPSVYWRRVGAKEFDNAQMTGAGGDYRASFLPPDGTTAVEYYIEAFDTEGNGPARVGAPEAPLTLTLAPAKAEAMAPPKLAPKATFAAAKPRRATATPADDQNDLAHTLDVTPPEPAWKWPAVIGLAVAGVALAVGGGVMLVQARADAAAFNDRFAKQGAYGDATSRSLSTRQGMAVGLLTGGGVCAGAGAGLLVVHF